MLDNYTRKDYNKDFAAATITNILGIIGWTYFGKLAYKSGHKKAGITSGVVGTVLHLIFWMIWVGACYERFVLANPKLAKLFEKTEKIND